MNLGGNLPALELGQGLEHLRSDVQLPASGVHQEQLLLNSKREWVGGAEGGGVEVELGHVTVEPA